MGNFLYITAIVLAILWAVGYFGYNLGELIHLLIVIALVAVLIRIITGNKLIK
jgi:hypothetical protein